MPSSMPPHNVAPPHKKNPLSPHLSIYRFSATMFMSILHRMTGVCLAMATVVFVCWLFAISAGEETYTLFIHTAQSLIGRAILFVITYVFFHHLYGGIRHFILDSGYCYDKTSITRLAHLTWILALLTTLSLWIYAYCMIH